MESRRRNVVREGAIWDATKATVKGMAAKGAQALANHLTGQTAPQYFMAPGYLNTGNQPFKPMSPAGINLLTAVQSGKLSGVQPSMVYQALAVLNQLQPSVFQKILSSGPQIQKQLQQLETQAQQPVQQQQPIAGTPTGQGPTTVTQPTQAGKSNKVVGRRPIGQ